MVEGGAVVAGGAPRFEGIQALRFVAAALVVVLHSTFYAHERLDPSVTVWTVGDVGVDVFFVISGFVMMVTSPPFVRHPEGWKHFAVRRLTRIVPMYWIATTLTVVAMLVLPGAALHSSLDARTVVSSYLFLPTRNLDGRVEPLLGVGWTLTFEMAFYLVFTLALLARARVYVVASAAMVLLAAGALLRPDPWPAAAVLLDPIVLYFVIGMTIARLVMDARWRRAVPLVLAGVVAVAVVVALLPGGFSWSRGAPLRMLVVAALVLAVVAVEPWVGHRLPRPVLYLGDASYSLYLFHPLLAPVVPVVLERLGLVHGALSVTLSVLGSFVAAAAIYAWVERPVLRRLRRLPYAGRMTTPTPAAAP